MIEKMEGAKKKKSKPLFIDIFTICFFCFLNGCHREPVEVVEKKTTCGSRAAGYTPFM